MDDKVKESIDRHIKLIQKLSTLDNVQLIVFVNVLSIDDPDIFEILTKVTEWEDKIFSEFMEGYKKENYPSDNA